MSFPPHCRHIHPHTQRLRLNYVTIAVFPPYFKQLIAVL